jgi:hypothetical protein
MQTAAGHCWDDFADAIRLVMTLLMPSGWCHQAGDAAAVVADAVHWVAAAPSKACACHSLFVAAHRKVCKELFRGLEICIGRSHVAWILLL